MINAPPSNVKQMELRLVDRAAAGDRDARHMLFELHRDAAYAVAVRITRREEDALDVVQDSFIRAFDRLGEFQREAGFRTWLLRIVTNRALDLLRARKVRLAIPVDPSDDGAGANLVATSSAPGARLERDELHARLIDAISSLPPELRAVFALYASGELTYGLIAEVLGIPIGTVMSRLFSARRRLQGLLPDLAPRGLSSTLDETTT